MTAVQHQAAAVCTAICVRVLHLCSRYVIQNSLCSAEFELTGFTVHEHARQAALHPGSLCLWVWYALLASPPPHTQAGPQMPDAAVADVLGYHCNMCIGGVTVAEWCTVVGAASFRVACLGGNVVDCESHSGCVEMARVALAVFNWLVVQVC